MIIHVASPPRVSRTERVILALLSRDRELFGLQIVERSGGAVKRGTVYVTLGRMHDKGFVESRTERLAPGAIRLPLRLYRLTPYGAANRRSSGNSAAARRRSCGRR